MARNLTVQRLDSGKFDYKKTAFAIEYSKDFDQRRAAVASGYAPDYGNVLKDDAHVAQVLNTILCERVEQSHIDAEWLLWELVDNHMIARQTGNITASNTALGIIGKHAGVDAFAADKLEVATGADVVERLRRGRNRLAQSDSVSAGLLTSGAKPVDTLVDKAVHNSEIENADAGGHPFPYNPHTAAEKNGNPDCTDFDKISDKNDVKNDNEKNDKISDKNDVKKSFNFF